MKAILLTNYPHDRQESMGRFAEALKSGLSINGVTVTTIAPRPFFGNVKPGGTGLGKWLGYIDKFVIFPFRLRHLARRSRREPTLFHICDHSNAMYEMWLRDVPVLVTCHDLLAVRLALGEIPTNRTSWTGRILQRWILSGLRKVHHVVCVSEATRADLIRLTHRDPDSARVVHNGLNHPYRPQNKEAVCPVLAELEKCLRVTLPVRYLFHVGGNQWYKNRIGLIRMYAELVKLDPGCPELLIAGKPHGEAVQRMIADAQLEERVQHVGRVSNEELNALYSGAEAFLFPSLAEGFGWPIIEAQASGCRVATSNRPPMSEIGGEAAVTVDPEDPLSAAAAIKDLLLEDATQMADRIQTGLENAERFTTEQMVRGYIHEYRLALSAI
jgi:glycosyltransferase involved in cell wall biosynthesis